MKRRTPEERQIDRYTERQHIQARLCAANLWHLVVEVATAHNVDPLELITPGRGLAKLVAARDELCWRLKQLPNASDPWIGQLLARDNCTVRYAIERHTRRRIQDGEQLDFRPSLLAGMK